MTPEKQVLLSSLLTFGVPLVLAVRELIVTRRRPSGGGRPRHEVPDEPRPRPLPDCLIPRLPPRDLQHTDQRTRTPELV
jgi:hypothetical protein